MLTKIYLVCGCRVAVCDACVVEGGGKLEGACMHAGERQAAGLPEDSQGW